MGKIIDIPIAQGITQQQVAILQKLHGKNKFQAAAQHRVLHILGNIVREPMFILLMIASLLYFILGNTEEGLMMTGAIIIVATISLYQEFKSAGAIDALKQLTEPRITVLRDGQKSIIPVEDLVPGDVFLAEEGMKIPADAMVLQANDLELNESIITGESMPVEKNELAGHNVLYQGTEINMGKCMARVTATGNTTILGKIGKSIEDYSSQKTLLQLQINNFVRKLALFGITAFVIIFLVNYIHYGSFATSLLFALTLAMAAVPEEIPVAFSSFMALGAYKMSRFGIISRQPQVIENLGSVNVLCLDKTGTITENKMQLKEIYDFRHNKHIDCTSSGSTDNTTLIYAMLASEHNPYDAMEKAIWDAYNLVNEENGYSNMKMVYEYPLG
ncbi:MAG: HAD-IC family P-type ATPase, partial [Chitinophagaceae bacterium]